MAARGWRVRFISSNGASIVVVREIQFRATVGGADLTSSSSVVISDGFFSNSPTWDATHAFDDTSAEYSTPNSSDQNNINHWVGVMFATPVDLAEITIQNRTSDLGSNASTAPRDFVLEYESEGGMWLAAMYVYNQTGWSNNPGGETRTFAIPTITATSTRWALLGHQSQFGIDNNFPVIGLRELEFRGSIGGAQQATGGTAISSSDFDGTVPASKAYDGTATPWVSAAPRPVSWIGYIFSSAVAVLQLLITARSDANPTQAPRDFDLMQSPDGILWVIVASFRYIKWTTAGQTQLVYVPPYAPSDSITAMSIEANVLTSGREDLLTAAAMRAQIAAGGRDDALVAASLRSQVAVGGYPDRIAAGAMRATAAVGGYPDRIAVAAIRACVLFQPIISVRPINGPVQIIGG